MDVVGNLGALFLVAPDRFVRAPLRARDDRRRVRLKRLHVLRRSAEQRATDEEGAQPFDAAAEPVLDPLGAADPEGVPEMPAAHSLRLGGVGIRQVVRLGG